jgi:hypothetical protein
MTPGILDIPIYKGAKWEHVLSFKVKGTQTPVDLTGLSPFVLTASHPKKDLVLVTGTVTDTDLAAGEITILFSAEQTDSLDLGIVRIGLRDAANNPYLANPVCVEFFSPPRA